MTTASPRRIEAAMSIVAQLRESIGDEDERLLRDTIEGQTDIYEICDLLADQALADGKLIEQAQQRVQRLERRQARARQTILRILEALEQRSLERAGYTASLARSPPAVILVDESSIPPGFRREVVDKPKLLRVLQDGNRVPGARLSNGNIYLTLRAA